jgi:hypothetical protein
VQQELAAAQELRQRQLFRHAAARRDCARICANGSASAAGTTTKPMRSDGNMVLLKVPR